MKTEYFATVKLNSAPGLARKLKEGENYVGVDEELAKELLETLKNIVNDVSLKYFMQLCTFEHYSEDINENGYIIKKD